MNKLKNLKIQQQKDDGIIPVGLKDLDKYMNQSPDNLQNFANPNSITNDNAGPIDGYWYTLQDWSQCSVKCGGGVSTFQRICIPPKKGGNPCLGANILTKPCNLGPCPKIITEEQKPIINPKAEIKVLPLNTKPKRFTPCKVKEDDLLYTKSEEKIENVQFLVQKVNKSVNQILARVVMNNRTISLYENAEDLQSLIVVFYLDRTNFLKSARDPNCFKLVDTEARREAELCPAVCNGNSISMLDEWNSNFTMFKTKCPTRVSSLEADFNNRLNEKIGEVKKQLLIEAQNSLKDKAALDIQTQTLVDLKRTNLIAEQAINKELNLELLIEQEEMQKEKEKEKELMIQIQQEEKKSVYKII